VNSSFFENVKFLIQNSDKADLKWLLESSPENIDFALSKSEKNHMKCPIAFFYNQSKNPNGVIITTEGLIVLPIEKPEQEIRITWEQFSLVRQSVKAETFQITISEKIKIPVIDFGTSSKTLLSTIDKIKSLAAEKIDEQDIEEIIKTLKESRETPESNSKEGTKKSSRIANTLSIVMIGMAAILAIGLENKKQKEILGKIPENVICKIGIGHIMGRPVNSVNINSDSNGTYFISYIRSSDNTTWKYRCKLEDNKIIWASEWERTLSSGRWRDQPGDDVVTFKVHNNDVFITEKYEDGSENSNVYTVNM
jgi:hypothetical protein